MLSPENLSLSLVIVAAIILIVVVVIGIFVEKSSTVKKIIDTDEPPAMPPKPTGITTTEKPAYTETIIKKGSISLLPSSKSNTAFTNLTFNYTDSSKNELVMKEYNPGGQLKFSQVFTRSPDDPKKYIYTITDINGVTNTDIIKVDGNKIVIMPGVGSTGNIYSQQILQVIG